MSDLYTTVLADPPWQYRDRVGPGLGFGDDRTRGRRGAAGYYPTMSVDEIIALYTPTVLHGVGRMRGLPAVKDVAHLDRYPLADNAHLYLWTTNAFMVQAHQVAEAWGFIPRTILTWCKPRIGMGHYYRNTTEHVVFAVRGRLDVLRRDQKTHFEAPVGRHSEKPAIMYQIIEQTSPGPYLELFARSRRAGWTSHGDELKCEPEEPILRPATPKPMPPAYAMLISNDEGEYERHDHVFPDPGLEWP